MAKNKAETIEKIVEMLRSDTYTIAEVCKASGIVPNTYHNWRRDDEEFAKAINDAKEERMQYFVAEAKKSLLKKIQGYTVDETKVVPCQAKSLTKTADQSRKSRSRRRSRNTLLQTRRQSYSR